MKRSIMRFFEILIVAGMLMFTVPANMMAQSNTTSDTARVTGPAEESSAFQDSVRFDDMDPIFYEAEEDEPVPEKKSTGWSPVTIAIILVVVLGVIIILIKKFTGKKK